MIVSRLTRLIREGVANAAGELGLQSIPEENEIELERPPRKEMGDFSTNVALTLGSRLAKPVPRAHPGSPIASRSASQCASSWTLIAHHLWRSLHGYTPCGQAAGSRLPALSATRRPAP